MVEVNLLDLRQKMIDYRAKNNFTQKELAEKCNVSMQTINSIECGNQSPSRLTLQKILNVITK